MFVVCASAAGVAKTYGSAFTVGVFEAPFASLAVLVTDLGGGTFRVAATAHSTHLVFTDGTGPTVFVVSTFAALFLFAYLSFLAVFVFSAVAVDASTGFAQAVGATVCVGLAGSTLSFFAQQRSCVAVFGLQASHAGVGGCIAFLPPLASRVVATSLRACAGFADLAGSTLVVLAAGHAATLFAQGTFAALCVRAALGVLALFVGADLLLSTSLVFFARNTSTAFA